MHAGWSCIRLNDGLNIKPVKFFFLLARAGNSLVWCLVIRGSTGGFLLLGYFSELLNTLRLSSCHIILFLLSPHL